MLTALLVCGGLMVIGFVVHFGWRGVAASLASLGVGGFLVFCGYTLGVFALLAVAWLVITPALGLRDFTAIYYGRLVREAAADVLPFAQMGGFLMGARAANLLGAPAAPSTASAIVDLGTEMTGQLLFTALGAVIIRAGAPRGFPHMLVDPILAVGLLAGAGTAGLFVFSQKAGLALLARLGRGWSADMRSQLSRVQQALERIYRRPVRPLMSVVAHLGAWLAASAGVWIVLQFMGARLSLSAVIALESLVYMLRSAAFLVPGAVGVLEGGYVVLGPIFGLRPEIALSLSLIKRGRDVAIGLPVVLIWQGLESRRWLGARRRREAI